MSSVFNACSYPFSSRTSNAQTDRTEDAYFYHRHCKHSEKAKFFQPMPGGFTNNFFFEFDKGVRTVRHLADTPDSEAWRVNLCANLDDCRKGVLIELLAQLILLQWFSTT